MLIGDSPWVVFRLHETCRFSVISKLIDSSLLDFVDRRFNHFQWHKEPLLRLRGCAEAIDQ